MLIDITLKTIAAMRWLPDDRRQRCHTLMPLRADALLLLLLPLYSAPQFTLRGCLMIR